MSRSDKDSVGGHTRRDIGIYLGGKLCAISWGEGWKRFAKRHEARRQRRLIPELIQVCLVDDESMQEAADTSHWDQIFEEDMIDDDRWHGDWSDEYNQKIAYDSMWDDFYDPHEWDYL